MFDLSEKQNLGFVLAMALLLGTMFTIYQQRSVPPGGAAQIAYTQSLVQPVSEVAELLRARKAIIVLAFRGEKNSMLSDPLEAMIGTISKGGVSVQKIEYLYRGNGGAWQERGGFPYGEFLRIAEAYPNADAVVSLCGPPYGAVAKDMPDPLGLPPLVLARPVIDTGDLANWMESGRVALAMVTPSANQREQTFSEGYMRRTSALWQEGFTL